MFLVAATKESEKKIHSCKYTFQQNFTPKAIALTNGDHAVKTETTYLIQALAKYTHKKHLVTGLPYHQSTSTTTTSLPNIQNLAGSIITYPLLSNY